MWLVRDVVRQWVGWVRYIFLVGLANYRLRFSLTYSHAHTISLCRCLDFQIIVLAQFTSRCQTLGNSKICKKKRKLDISLDPSTFNFHAPPLARWWLLLQHLQKFKKEQTLSHPLRILSLV